MLKLFYLLNFVFILFVACCEDKIHIIECEVSGQMVEFETHDKPVDCWDSESKTWYVRTINGYKIISDNCHDIGEK